MDGKEQEQHWLTSHRISRSPSPYAPEQAASPAAGTSGDRSSIQATMERQPSSQDQSRAGETPDRRWDWTRQHPGAGSETPRTKRRRRSSSLDQGGQLQGCDEGLRGRDHHPPPARRQRIGNDWESNWISPASSSLAAETRISRQISRSLSPQGYRTSEGGPSHQGGELSDRAPFGRSSWNPPDIPSDRNREDVLMRSVSPPCLPPVDMVGSSDGHDHSHLGSHDWGASQERAGSRRHPVQEPAMEFPSNDAPYSQRAQHASPPVQSYGPTYNIANAGNVFTGTNNGNVYMGSVTVQLTDEFMINLADRLKICVRADHMYHASDEESALRRVQCTRGTRTDLIEGVTSWATNTSPRSELVYWLSGQAGAGKTTIAYTIACLFETLVSNGNSKVILGGSFFCSRQFPDTRSTSAIIRALVYQLALKSKPFQVALKVHGRLEVVNHGPRSQLMGLLIEPWKMSAAGRLANGEPCYILPIDALDELDGESGSEFLGVLFDVLEQHDLSGLKFFITSRSHPALVDRIQSFSNKQVCRLEQMPLEESSADIKVYLNASLGQCATPEQIQHLVSDAAGLFIYAATVVKYLKGRGLEQQRSLLTRILSTPPSSSRRRPRNATATLDSLYLQILETSLVDTRDHGDPDVFEDCLSILHTFLCTVERTSATVAVAILKEGGEHSEIDNGTTEGVLLRLHAVLYIQDGQVMSFHKSFSDFLFNHDRSKEFYCNQEQLHQHLANGCFWIMARQLRFNIANIPTSYQMDSNNPALPMCIDANISASLRYACRNWSAHLTLTPFGALDGFAKLLHNFLQLQVLFWMEAMSLLRQRGWCQRMLRDAQQWLSQPKGPMELVGKLADAAAFAAYHSASKAALSTPHLYLSSLATFSRHSAVVQDWRKQFRSIPGLISAHGVHGEALVACIPVRSEGNAIAISPDGVNIAVGSDDGLVQVLDLSTGEEVRVLKGHTNWVYAVAYSPDGSHVVSGSKDRSIRVWDVATGKEVRVLEGHTDVIYTVAYSPDGIHVVSGSGDESIRVWDVARGKEVRVLEGHTNLVFTVAYSPDGSHVVSGSEDNSIQVWDAATGKEVRVLEGHTDGVNAVAYSPDGSHVVSGSYDKSIRVWDVAAGEQLRVLGGHTDWVNAVAYSPDGSHVVSGSGDKSVQVWNVSPKYTPCYICQQDPNGQYTGWLVSPADPSAYLMYVQPGALLPDASNVLTIPASAVSHLDLSNAKLGGRWAECYTPRPF